MFGLQEIVLPLLVVVKLIVELGVKIVDVELVLHCLDLFLADKGFGLC